VAYSAMTQIPQSDPYHFVAIRWQQAFPIVPGLANLDGRLGFNNASFLLHSLFSNWFEEFGLIFFHGALYLILFSCAIAAVVRSVAKRRVSIGDACDVLMICPLFFIGLDYRDTFAIANVSPDLTLLMLQVALVRSWVVGIHGLTSGTPGALSNEHLALALLLAVACVCTKLSSAVFSAALILAAAAQLMKHRPDATVCSRVSWSRVLGATVVVVAIWAGRGTVLSGYPAYPSSVLAMPVAWRVSESMRTEELKMISDSARYMRPMSGSDVPWFADWFRAFCNFSWDVKPGMFNSLGRSILPAGLALLGAILWGSGMRHRGNTSESWVPLFSLAGGIAIITWFAMAPDPRFAAGIFYGLVAVFFIPTVRRLNQRQRGWLVGLLVAVASIAGLYDRARIENSRKYSHGSVLASLLAPPPPNSTGRFVFPKPSLIAELRCDSGLVVYVCGDDYTWHAPLTTAETLYEGWNRLSLRSSQLGLRSGFSRL